MRFSEFEAKKLLAKQGVRLPAGGTAKTPVEARLLASEVAGPVVLPIDFAFLDCGGYANYQAFMEEYWPLINPDGGLLLVHSTLTNLEGLAFLKGLKLRQATGGLAEFELLSLLEPHKTRQNNCTLLRKIAGVSDRIHSYQP